MRPWVEHAEGPQNDRDNDSTASIAPYQSPLSGLGPTPDP